MLSSQIIPMFPTWVLPFYQCNCFSFHVVENFPSQLFGCNFESFLVIRTLCLTTVKFYLTLPLSPQPFTSAFNYYTFFKLQYHECRE